MYHNTNEVVLRDDGVPDFNALQNAFERRSSADIVYSFSLCRSSKAMIPAARHSAIAAVSLKLFVRGRPRVIYA